MPFDKVLDKSCRLPGTSHTEPHTGKAVKVQPKSGESITFYKIDNEEFRKEFGVSRVCDLLVDYKCKQTRTLLFLELQGKKLQLSEEQIRSAVKAVLSCFKEEAEIRALVVSSTVNNLDKVPLVQRLLKDGVSLRTKSMRKGTLDIGEFLRN